MSGKQRMYYIGFCRICSTGPLGLRRCGECGSVVVLCEECDAVWTSADLKAKPHLAQVGELPCPECNSSLVDAPSRWATKAQIEATDWLQQAILRGEIELQRGSAFAPDAADDDQPQDDVD
jgi:hypothetical protein